MRTTFSIPIDEIPDALDLEPDIDGIDWIEDDPDLGSGPVHLYVHRASTALLTIEVSEAMTLDVHVPATAAPADWTMAIDVVERAMLVADTALVTMDGSEPVELAELRAACDAEWRAARAASAVQFARQHGDVLQLTGPNRVAYIGSQVLSEIASDGADDTEQGQRLLDVLRRVQWVNGPHDRAVALDVPGSDGSTSTVAVIGPLLRYVLPPTDRLLIENGDLADDAAELLIPSAALDSLPGVQVRWLDDGNRLMEAVPEAAWPAVIVAAEAHRLAQ